MSKPLALLCSCLALALVGAGCGGDDEEEGGGGARTQEQTVTEDEGGAAAPAKAVTVSMKEIEFRPKTVTVAKGSTVKWVNDDSVNHDVTKVGGPGREFKSGTGDLARGDTYQQRFATAGTVQYVCTVHPGMEGTVVVK